jgi:hypothetical protein
MISIFSSSIKFVGNVSLLLILGVIRVCVGWLMILLGLIVLILSGILLYFMAWLVIILEVAKSRFFNLSVKDIFSSSKSEDSQSKDIKDIKDIKEV